MTPAPLVTPAVPAQRGHPAWLPAGILLAAAALVALCALVWAPLRPALALLLPWEFWPSVMLATIAALWLYARGVRRAARLGVRTALWRQFSFYGAVLALYLAMQSQVDYYAQHMFYIHRLQHLVLHHLGPFFAMLAAPQRLLVLGMPRRLRRHALRPLQRARVVRAVLRFSISPIVATVLFVGGIGIWLISSMHFYVMLSLPLYKLMNWSMLIDGLPFWWLILDARGSPPARMGYGGRVIILWIVMVAQILIGSIIGLAEHDLYPVYAICGRAFAISPIVDQHLGGLVVWIPGAMMSVIATIVVLSFYRRERRRRRAG